MASYRIHGWFRDSMRTDSVLTFEAPSDKEAWAYELPPKFLSRGVEKLEGDKWVELILGEEEFKAALHSLITGIVK